MAVAGRELLVNLMVGTDPSGKGGIASVVAVLNSEGFLRRHGIVYVVSHVEGDIARKFVVGMRAFALVLWVCVSSRPSIVHVHAASRGSFLRKSVVLAIARTFGCRTIFHLHGGGFQIFSEIESGRLMQWWIRRTLARSSKVIALSNSWATFIGRFAPAADVEVIPNSVRVTADQGFAGEEPGRILFLGRAERSKGIFELLNAVSALTESVPDVKLVVGGDGNLDAVRTCAREMGISDRLEILGWAGPDLKARELARATVFALPSHDEGLPMAMLEAMSASKAVVVTPVGGIPEVVTSGENGLLVPPDNVAALADALQRVLTDRDLRRRLAANARATIEARLSSSVILARLSSLYERLESGRAT